MSFFVRKTVPINSSGLPVGDPNKLLSQPKGTMVYSSEDDFVYISDGTSWDRVSGVNNPADLLLPITQNRVAKWTQDYPPGGAYTSPVLQDSSFEVDDDGNAILHDTGNTPSAFPWFNGNLMVQGSLSTSYTFGISTSSTDPMSFSPVLTQTKGDDISEGSVAIGASALEEIVSLGPEINSKRNVAIGVSAGKQLSQEAQDNVFIGSGSSKDTKYAKKAVSVGSDSSVMKSGNVVVGYGSSDSNLESVIVLGSEIEAKDRNSLVLGSGIKTIDINVADKETVYIKVQIGDEIYLMPLIKA